jgi:prevent-host-death family protein
MEKYIEDTTLTRDFCKGQSAKLFKKVKDTKKPLRVTRNGKDYVVILDFYEYIKMIDKINSYEKSIGVRKNDKN